MSDLRPTYSDTPSGGDVRFLGAYLVGGMESWNPFYAKPAESGVYTDMGPNGVFGKRAASAHSAYLWAEIIPMILAATRGRIALICGGRMAHEL